MRRKSRGSSRFGRSRISDASKADDGEATLLVHRQVSLVHSVTQEMFLNEFVVVGVLLGSLIVVVTKIGSLSKDNECCSERWRELGDYKDRTSICRWL